MCRYLFVLFLILSSQVTSTAQTSTEQDLYSFRNSGLSLPDKRISGIVQDSRGFLWLSTYNGLYRYDGNMFKIFRSSPMLQSNLDFDQILKMSLLYDRYLVLEGEKLVNILDLETESLIYRSDPEDAFIQLLHNEPFTYLHFEKPSMVSKIIQFDSTGATSVLPVSFPDDIRMEEASSNAEGNLYFFDRKGRLYHFLRNTGQFRKLDSLTHTGRRPLHLPELYCDSQNRLWCFDNNFDNYSGYYLFTDANTWTKQGDLPATTIVIPREIEDEFWLFAVPSGTIGVLDLRENTFRHLLHVPKEVGHLNAIYQDRQQNIWLGSRLGSDQNILLAQPHLQAFGTLLSEPGKEFDVGVACRALAEHDGKILIGSQDGLYQWDPGLQFLELQKLKSPELEIELQNFWAIIPLKDNNTVWFSKEDSGIFFYDLETGLTTNFIQLNKTSNRILGMYMDEHGILWCGSRSGITWFNTNTLTFLPSPSSFDPFYDVSTYKWVRTDTDVYWLCSSNGLYVFNANREEVRRYGTNTDPFLNSNEVYDLVQVEDTYWIATNFGLHSLRDDSIQIYTTDDGLASNSVASLACDGTNLWIATFNGLSRMHLGDKTIQNFYVSDGLPHNEFNRLGALTSYDGTMYFSTQNGVVYFKPEEVIKETVAFPLVITGFTTFNKDGDQVSAPVHTLKTLDTILLPAGNKYFELEIALLNFIQAKGNRYSYFMEGLETGWRSLSRSNLIQYNNLPPGTYTLHVHAVDPSGMPAKNTLDLTVIVRQHFYTTRWFLLLLFLFTAGIVYAITRYRIGQRLKVERMRTKISSDLHDEVGGVLGGVAMQMEVLEGKAPESIRGHLKRIAETSRSAASRMRDVIWSIDAGKDQYQDLIDRMKAHLLEMLEPLDITYNFTQEGIELKKTLNNVFRQEFYLIFKEAVNNIARHSGASHVNVDLKEQKGALNLRVADNGRGISAGIASSGQGLTNMQRRAGRIGADLTIQPGRSGGTEIILNAYLK